MDKPNLKINYIIRTIYDVCAILIPFVTMPYVTRVLGPENCGIYSFTHANVTYFMLFAVLGTSGYGIRTISRNRNNKKEYSKLFCEIEILSVISSAVSITGFVLFYHFVEEYKPYYLILSILIVTALLDISWLFSGLEHIGIQTIVNVSIKIIGTVCVFVFVKEPNDLTLYFLINVLVQFLSNLSMWLFVPRYIIRVPIKELRVFRHLSETMIFFIPTIAISIYTVLDKTLIGLITHETAQNGYYDNATQIINGVKTIVFASISTVVGARTTYLFAENKTQEVKNKINVTINYILFLAIGSGFGILAVADNFVPLFLGDRFLGAVPLLKLMTPLIAIIGVSYCIGSLYYSPIGKRKTSACFLIAGSVCNLFFNLLLIPRLGAVGATIGTIIAETTISFLYLRFCDQYFTFKQLLELSYKKLIAGIVMFILVYFLGYLIVNPYLLIICQIIIGAIVYIVFLSFLKDSIIGYMKSLILNIVVRIKDGKNR